MKLSFSDKCVWAKKAAKLDVDTNNEGYTAFSRIAKESGLGEMWLSYYSNAYEAAGDSGIKALTYKRKIPAGILKKAMKKINTYLYNRIPPKLRKEIGFLVKGHYNRITVSEKRPLFTDPSITSCSKIFQFRYTGYDDRWHLYWMRKFRKWWPYVPQKPIHTIENCLKEVDADVWGCFWG